MRSICLPKDPNAGLFNSTWLTLESVFKAYPPYPATLPRIPLADGARAPSLELIQIFTKLSFEDATLSRESHSGVLKGIRSCPENTFSGRGIIMLAGGRCNVYAATALGVIREIGSRLLVEVWMNDTMEEKKGWCDELAKGIMCKWLSHIADWDQRVSAQGSDNDVLILRAIPIPRRGQPACQKSRRHFRLPEFYRQWCDPVARFWDRTGAPLLSYIVGLTDGTVPEGQDSRIRPDCMGQEETLDGIKPQALLHASILILVPHSLSALLLIITFMDLSITIPWPSKGFACWGDKDTFLLTLKAMHEDYYMVPFDLETLFNNGTMTGVR